MSLMNQSCEAKVKDHTNYCIRDEDNWNVLLAGKSD